MGTQIAALPHSCGTQFGLKVFAQEDGSIDGYCFACETAVPHPYGVEKKATDLPQKIKKSPEEVALQLAEISNYPVVDVPVRKLRARTLEKFDARVSLSEFDGETPTAIYWPVTNDGQLVGYHVKILNKKYPPFNIGDTKGGDLIGWEQAKKSGARKIYITEGPEDMASVDAIFERFGDPEWHPAVVSLPRGASSATKALTKHAAELKRFKEIVLVFDDDEAGKAAVERAMLVLPNATSVTLPCKDANQCILDGLQKAAYQAMSFKNSAPKNTRLLTGAQLHIMALEPAKFGELTWPFDKMQDDLRGARLGETIYTGAGVKCGKSTLKNAFAAHWMKNDGVKVFMACPEEDNKKGYKLLASQITGKVFTDPKIEFDADAYEKAGEVLREKLLSLSLYQYLGWETLKDDIKEAVNEHGAKVVIIDPVTNLTNGIDPSSTNTFLQGFAQEISAMAKDMNFLALIFCHLNTPEGQISEDQRQKAYKQGKYWDLGNCSHELGGSVYSTQFAGSRGMMRSCNLMMAIKANKDVSLTRDIQDTRILTILEDREWNNNTQYPLFYDRETHQFKEI